MRSYALFSLLVICSARGLSQNTILPGYVVKHGDTVRGNLKQARERDLAQAVSFQAGGEGAFIVYTPSDLTAFRYEEGDLYRSISFTNKQGPGVEAVFAKTLVSGTYSLYVVDEDGDTYYVVRKDTATWLLYDDRTSVTGMEIIPGNYRNQLLFFSAGCEGLDATKVRYSQKDLIAFLLQVNQCQAPGVASSTYFVKPRWEKHCVLYLGIMPTSSNTQTTLDAALRLVNPRFDPKVSVNIALHYSASANLTPRQWNLVTGLTDPNITLDSGASYSVDVLSVPLTLQYNLFTGRIQPVVYVGFSAAYLWTNPEQLGSGQRFTVALVGGAGIEAYVSQQFLIKADWRYEFLVQNFTVGIGWKF